MSAPLPFETATWPRRMLALAVDWFASTLVTIFFLGFDRWLDESYSNLVVMGVFVVESALFTATVGGSFGQVATRLRVVRATGDPRQVDLLPAFARQVLVALVVPPLVFRPDGRGLHDLATGTACVTLQTATAVQARPGSGRA